MSINDSVSRVREILLQPKDQAPTLHTVFGALTRQVQVLYNDLANSSNSWTTNTASVPVSTYGDYVVPASNAGRVLFVTLSRVVGYTAIPVEFTDLEDASSGWWWNYPLVPDESNRPIPVLNNRVAFFRQNGQLKFRIGAGYAVSGVLNITYASGNWTADIDPNQSQVLSEYSQLAEYRAARNLLEGCEWKNEEFDDKRKARLLATFREQIAELEPQWIIAKRGLTAGQVSFRDTEHDNDFLYY